MLVVAALLESQVPMSSRQAVLRYRHLKACPFILLHFASARSSSSAPVVIRTRSHGHHHRLPLPIRGGGPIVSTGASASEMSSAKYTRDDNFAIGGGAINEKERLFAKGRDTDEVMSSRAAAADDSTRPTCAGNISFDPNSLSHSLHAAVGMDRYPNYLSRWAFDDIDQLEASLERQLREVRQQKELIQERRDGISLLMNKIIEEEKMKGNFDDRLTSVLDPPRSWEDVRDNILDPRAADKIFKSKVFRGVFKTRPTDSSMPRVKDVMDGKISLQLDPAQLELWMEQEMFDVYSFPLLSTEFCHRIRKLMRKVVSAGEEEEFNHLNLGRRPVDLDTVGLGWINNLLFHLIIRPLSQHLFIETEEFQDLDWRQGYIAGYSVNPSAPAATPRQRLVPHTDDSEVTLNIGLGDEFEGGILQFRGLRGTDEEGNLLGEFRPQLGTALLHAGRHLHEVTPVTSGDRYAFIIWARSWKSLRNNTCPCCWLNRRQGPTCVCGPRWN